MPLIFDWSAMSRLESTFSDKIPAQANAGIGRLYMALVGYMICGITSEKKLSKVECDFLQLGNI